MFSTKLKRAHYVLVGALFSIAASLWFVVGLRSDAPKPAPATRPETHQDIEVPRERQPRIPLPAAGSGYLPETWGGGGGLGGYGQLIGRVARDRQGLYPDPRLDDLFTDPAFWLVSRANECHYCLAHQELKLRAGGLDDNAIAALDGNWSLFSPRQQAVLAYAQKLTLEPHLVGESDIAGLKTSFSDGEIVELTFNIARFNSVNRWTSALGFAPERQLGENPDGVADAATSEPYRRTVSSLAIEARTPRGPLPSSAEIAAAVEACRARTARVDLPSDAEAQAVLTGAIGDRAPLAWERALSDLPEIGKTQVVVWNTILTDDHLPPRLKAELAYISAVNNRAWYAVGCAERRLVELGVSPEETASLLKVELDNAPGPAAAYRLAAKLTTDPHLIADADIASIREHFSDPEAAQIVHVICMANLFDRFTESLGLPLE